MALIFDSKIVPNTDAVRNYKTHGLQFTPDDANTYVRKPNPLTMGVVHWTGGEGGYAQVYRTLKKRLLSVHFFVAYDGTVYQYADPARVVCAHAGAVNQFAYGIEVQNQAFGASHPKFARGTAQQTLHGETQGVLMFTTAQVDAVIALCDTFVDLGVHPRRVKLGTDVLPAADRPKFKGVLGHLHVSSRKLDPGTQIFEEMVADGWKGV
jgi:N-acetyl-anhydromuramyl-L-alanine amidase AmpD